MLDHAFLAAVDAVRRSLDNSMLDRAGSEERLQFDILGGDLTWETTCSLPGEGKPPRVRADVTLDWPTWSQTASRSFQLEGELDEPPELGIEVVLRVQQLADPPDVNAVRAVLDDDGPDLGGDRLLRSPAMVEQIYDDELAGAGWAVEFVYEGTFDFTEPVLADLNTVHPALEPLGPWVASVLVRLGDLRFAFIPPDPG